MQNKAKYLFLISSVVFLTACSSTRNFQIEILKPAEITVPTSVKNVLIVNNAAPQYGQNSRLAISAGDSILLTTGITMDSLIFQAISVMGEVLSESEFFSRVDIYTAPVREDDKFLEIRPLSEEFLSDFYTDYDMLISADRFLFLLEDNAKIDGKDELSSTYKSSQLKASLTVGVYMKPGTRSKPSFSEQDSLILHYSTTADNKIVFLREPAVMSRVLASILGGVSASKFLPDWNMEERTLYTKGSRMREAASYAKAENWEKALQIWLMEYEKAKTEKDKAYLSSNVALAYEMKNEMETAKTWAEKSENHFDNSDLPQTDKDVKWIKSYVKSLQKRILDNSILDIQLGTKKM